MDALTDWWDALDGAMKFFYTIAFASTLVLAIQTGMMLFGFDTDGADADFDVGDLDHGGDLDPGGDHGGHDVSMISVRSVTAFLVGLGWMGAILRDLGWSLLLVVPLALIVGFILMMFVWWFMKLLHSLSEKGNMDYVYAIGETGSVYLPIPPNREKAGKVEVMIQGRLTVVDAFTDDTVRIENRTKVRVLDVIDDNTLVVEAVE
jgi:membrane protein implicated in regulation of membrane protease activity